MKKRHRQKKKRRSKGLLPVILVLFILFGAFRFLSRQFLRPRFYLKKNVTVKNMDSETEEYLPILEEKAKEDPDYQEILDHLEELPSGMIALGATQPEAKGFVLGFLKNNPDLAPKTKDFGREKGTWYLQWDQKWGYVPYAGGCIGTHGCGPTSLAMILTDLGIPKTPAEVAAYSEDNGHVQDGMTGWSLIDDLAHKYDLKINGQRRNLSSFSGNYPILVSFFPGDFTKKGHMAVLFGRRQDGTWHVLDPNSVENTKRHWTDEELEPQIRRVWEFQR